MAVQVVKNVVTTVTITMDGDTAILLRDFLDPDAGYVHLKNEPELQNLLTALSAIRNED